jgi:predicted MFS family arabinose efflux permease
MSICLSKERLMSLALRDHRIVITAACLIALVTFGSRAGFGLFLEPISSTHGWGREIFAVAIGIQNIMWGIGQPIAGALADRYGTRRVLIVGAVIYAAGLMLMSTATTPSMLHVSAGFLIGVGGAGASFTLVMAAVSRMVSDERRSWALGLIVASSSLGQFLIVPLGQSFIDLYGWMTALVLIGFLVLAVLPLSLPFDDRTKGSGIAAQTLGQALKEAMGHRSYLLLVAGFFVCGYHVAFIQTHLPAYIVDAGIAARVGAYAIALVGLFNIVGSYTAGVLGGRWSKKNLLAMIYAARAVVIALYVTLPISETSTLFFAAAMGLLWLSTVPLTSGLVAVMFGPRYMATLFGIVFLSHQMGAFLGVWLGGWAYDTFGSYTAVWWSGVGLAVAAALIHLPISERPVARIAAPA